MHVTQNQQYFQCWSELVAIWLVKLVILVRPSGNTSRSVSMMMMLLELSACCGLHGFNPRVTKVATPLVTGWMLRS